MTFQDLANNRIGLSIAGDDISSTLGIRTILAIFQTSGQCPLVILRLKILIRLGAMFSAVCFNILPDMPSIPVDLETSSLSRAVAVVTYSSVIKIDSEQVGEVGSKTLVLIRQRRKTFVEAAEKNYYWLYHC